MWILYLRNEFKKIQFMYDWEIVTALSKNIEWSTRVILKETMRLICMKIFFRDDKWLTMLVVLLYKVDT